MIARMRSTTAAAKPQRRVKASVLHRFIDQLLYCLLDRLALRRRLLKQHEKHVLLAVDHEITAAGAVPFQFPQRARRRGFRVSSVGAHGKTEPKTKTVAGEIEAVAPDAGPLAHLTLLLHSQLLDA